MKLKNTLALMSIASLALSACEDMDTLPEGSTVTDSQKTEVKKNDPSKTSASVAGAFMSMSAVMPNSSTVGSNHGDIGYPTVMLATDNNGEDMVSPLVGYNWFSREIQFTDRSVTAGIAQIIWQDFYSYIKAANDIIASIDENTDDAEQLFNMANARALRAFSYFQLAQLYQFNYVGNEDQPCVPIITEENQSEYISVGAKRSTVEEVYALVRSDLDFAVEALSATSDYVSRDNKRYIDLATAYGLRARVNLVMQKWADAAADATNAIENSTATPATIAEVSAPGFSSADESNWMWGILIAETDDVVSSGIVNFPSHIGSFNYGYAMVGARRLISKKLYETISETDVRKGWWLNENGESANLTTQAQLSYIYSRHYNTPYLNVKFGPYNGVVGTSTSANDIPLMRIEEMYLIKAEGEAMSGADGLTTLTNFVKTYRDPEYSYSGSDIQHEIWRQRRIELWGEGMSWFDVMRLKTGIDRRNTGCPRVYVIDHTDTKLLWPIPESEVEANQALTEADYNPITASPAIVSDDETASIDDEKVNI